MGKTTEMKIILTVIPDDESMASSMMVASEEKRYIDTLETDDDVMMDTHPKYQMIPHDANKVASILGEVSPLCDSIAMYQLLKERGEISHMSCALGSTTVAQESILIDRQEFSDNESVCSVSSIHSIDDAMKVKLVDATLKYNCPHEDKSYILLVRNALHAPSMDHNLIPPFMLREAGITVNETPKIHKKNPTADDHAITFSNSGLRIPLGLWGVFSYFPTSMTSTEEVNTSKNVYTLTPNRWNPHTKQYANCEQNLIDWEGKVMGKTTAMKIILADIQDDEGMTSSMMVASAEIRYMDALEMDDDVVMDTHPKY
jgi:hypothetical protein